MFICDITAPAQVLGFDEPPNGLQLLEDFITLDTEQTLLDMVSLDKSTEKSMSCYLSMQLFFLL